VSVEERNPITTSLENKTFYPHIPKKYIKFVINKLSSYTEYQKELWKEYKNENIYIYSKPTEERDDFFDNTRLYFSSRNTKVNTYLDFTNHQDDFRVYDYLLTFKKSYNKQFTKTKTVVNSIFEKIRIINRIPNSSQSGGETEYDYDINIYKIREDIEKANDGLKIVSNYNGPTNTYDIQVLDICILISVIVDIIINDPSKKFVRYMTTNDFIYLKNNMNKIHTSVLSSAKMVVDNFLTAIAANNDSVNYIYDLSKLLEYRGNKWIVILFLISQLLYYSILNSSIKLN
jgi:hypothetical protein